MISPPAFSIFSLAPADTFNPLKSNFWVSSPSPKIFTSGALPLILDIKPRLSKAATVTNSPSLKIDNCPKFKMAGLFRIFLKL